MGTQVELKAADGHSFNAYLAQPSGKPKGGMIVVQEIFGVNKHIRDVADGYAADGYLAIAPAFYDRVQRGFDVGYEPKDMEAGFGIMQKVKWDEVLQDAAAALTRVKTAGKVGIVGYCWGGTAAWLAAAKLDGLACAIPYYGGGIYGVRDQKPRVPVLCHFGELDKSPTPEQAKEIIAAQPGIEHFFYPGAGHGFNCTMRGSYNPEAAKLAKQRTLEFLTKHVG
jgi:carboxymethylenebutenolidase